MKYALIGCGRISPNHIEATKNNFLEMVAICDIVPENMADKIQKFSLPDTVKQYADYRELLEKEKPELVAIATESGKHAAIAIECINAGCNIIIEKPIALSIEDAERIIKRAFWYAQIIRIALISLCSISARLWRKDASADFSTVLPIYAGTEDRITTHKLRGAVRGNRTVVR